MKATTLLFAAGLLLASTPAPASDIDYAQSRIGFTFRQMNVPVEGSFRKFRVQLRFDEQRPESASAQIEVVLSSIDTGAPDGDTEAQRKPWFDAGAHPTARFVSNSVKRLAPGRFELSGKLSIKGRTRDLKFPVEMARVGAARHFTGGFVLKRLEYTIGEGPWADVETVADEVQVRFRIVQRNTATP